MAELIANRRRSLEEMSVLCGSILCWYHLVPSSNSRPLWSTTHYCTVQDNVLLPSDFAEHIPRSKLPRSALDHSIRFDSGWQRRQERETCGVDIHKVVADFRDAFERNQSSSSQTWLQQELFFSITCAEEAQCLQLEPWTPTGKRRCLRETNCRKVAPQYPTRSFWLCRTRNPSWTTSRDLLFALRNSLQ